MTTYSSGELSTPLDKRATMKDAEFTPKKLAEESVVSLSHEARIKRRQYLSKPTSDLRSLAGSMSLKVPDAVSRLDIIRMLEETDEDGDSCVDGSLFEGFFLVIVVLNAISIGLQIDQPSLLSASSWMMINFFFYTAFMIEFSVKVLVKGWRKYINDPWNMFDFIVLLGVSVEMSAHYSVMSQEAYQMFTRHVPGDFVQILRMCRLFRLARFFNEIGMLIQSFLDSFKALFWIMVLLIVWFYMCACVATIFIGHREVLPSEDAEAVKDLRDKFRSIPMSMFALFEVMTLEGWVDYVRPLLKTRVHLVMFFLGFIFITAFFMLNLITAIVVDRTVSAQKGVDESVQKEQLEHRKARITHVCELLKRKRKPDEDDEDEDDGMTFQEYNSALDDPDVKQAMEEMAWDRRYMLSMWNLVNHESGDYININDLQQILEVSHQALDTDSYVKFQDNMVQKIEFQEKLMFTVLNTLQVMSEGKITLPAHLELRMKMHSLLEDKTLATNVAAPDSGREFRRLSVPANM